MKDEEFNKYLEAAFIAGYENAEKDMNESTYLSDKVRIKFNNLLNKNNFNKKTEVAKAAKEYHQNKVNNIKERFFTSYGKLSDEYNKLSDDEKRKVRDSFMRHSKAESRMNNRLKKMASNESSNYVYDESNNLVTRGAYILAKIKNRLSSNNKEERSARNRKDAATLGRIKFALKADKAHSDLYGDNSSPTRGKIHNYQTEKKIVDKAKSHYNTMTNAEKRYGKLVKDIEARRKNKETTGKQKSVSKQPVYA